MKSENRHYTKVWKKKRLHKHADRCGNPKCLVCHGDKILNIPNRQLLRTNSKYDKNNGRLGEKGEGEMENSSGL